VRRHAWQHFPNLCIPQRRVELDVALAVKAAFCSSFKLSTGVCDPWVTFHLLPDLKKACVNVAFCRFFIQTHVLQLDGSHPVPALMLAAAGVARVVSLSGHVCRSEG